MRDDDDPHGLNPFIYFGALVALLILLGLAFAAVRFYGLR